MDYVKYSSSLLARSHMNETQLKYINSSWAPKFKELILYNLPMEDIRKLFCRNNGRPTKELRSVTGAIILQHMYNFSDEQTCYHFLFDNLWIEALDIDLLDPENRYLSPRTLWEHTKRLTQSGLLPKILNSVNQGLLKCDAMAATFGLQRLDSVQVIGNMAKLSRIQLFVRTVKSFLKKLKKDHKDEFSTIEQTVKTKYLSDDKESSRRIFGFNSAPREREASLTAIARDIYDLAEKFKNHPRVAGAQSFKNLRRLFSDQCEVLQPVGSEDSQGPVRVELKAPKDIPADALQNPSDPDAAYSRHKGQGYHVQVMETCGPPSDGESKPLNVITYVHVEGANVHDGKSTIPAIEAAIEAGFKPDRLLADAAYGGDENELKAKELGVELISPVIGKEPAGKKNLADFTFEGDEATARPEGQKPWATAVGKGDKRFCGFDKRKCDLCPKSNFCATVLSGDKAQLSYTPKDLRLSKRRAKERTEEFKNIYSLRSGIEATNSRLARETSLKRLRYRGLRRISLAVHFKAIGLNFKRVLAAVCLKKPK